MNILVSISQVPDTATKVNVAADGLSIDRTGVKFILNPYDEFAVEEALRLKEKNAGSTVTVLSVGGEAAKEAMRVALAMGADNGILVKDETAAGDSFVVAANIAHVVKELAPSIVFMGKQSVDYDGSELPSMVSELTGLPSATVVVKLDIQGGKAVCEREVEGGREIVELTMPAIIGAQKGLNDPRYPSLPNIMKAKSKPIEERALQATSPRVKVRAMRKPAAKAAGKIVAGAAELVQSLHNEAKVI